MLRTRYSRSRRLSNHLHPSFGEISFRSIARKVGAFDEEFKGPLSRLVLLRWRLLDRCIRARRVSPFNFTPLSECLLPHPFPSPLLLLLSQSNEY